VIPYFNRPPYSQHPVRPLHLVLIAVYLVLFAASWWLLGGLLTLRLLVLGMMLYAVGLWSFFIRRALRALRTKETLTIYGSVALADRPTLFVVLWIVQVTTPLVLLAVLVFVARDLQLFRWVWTW